MVTTDKLVIATEDACDVKDLFGGRTQRYQQLHVSTSVVFCRLSVLALNEKQCNMHKAVSIVV